MTKTEKQLIAIAKQLQSLAQKIDKLAGVAAKEVPAKVSSRAKVKRRVKKGAIKKAAVKPRTVKKMSLKKEASKKTSVMDAVHVAIKKSRKGIRIATIQKKTGLEIRQLSNALYKLTKKGLVKTESRGIYIAA